MAGEVGATYESIFPPGDQSDADARCASQVGIDPNTIASGAAAELRSTLEAKKMHLEAVEENLVDAVWEGRPAFPDAPLRVHALDFAGVSVADKLATLREGEFPSPSGNSPPQGGGIPRG